MVTVANIYYKWPIFDQNEKLEFEIIKKVKLLQRNVRLWLERRRLGVIGNNDEKRHKGIVSQNTKQLRNLMFFKISRNYVIISPSLIPM